MSTDKAYHFSVNDAVRWKSSDIAVILSNLRFWLRHNLANERSAPEDKQPHIHDGKVWTYNTVNAWSELFPWLSGPQIKRLLKKIEDGGLLIKGSYNQGRYDRTTWYSLDEPEFYVNRATASENKEWTNSSTRQDGIVQGVDGIVLSSTDNKQQISKSVNSKPAEKKFHEINQSFFDSVMTELQADNLPASKVRYAGLKIREFRSQYPSGSTADCWAYVVQAVNHQIGLTGP